MKKGVNNKGDDKNGEISRVCASKIEINKFCMKYWIFYIEKNRSLNVFLWL